MKLINKINLILNNLFELIFPKSREDLFLEEVDFEKLKEKVLIRRAEIHDTGNCGAENCGVENCFYLFSYKNKIIKTIIWALKFRGRKDLSVFLGEVLAENLWRIVGGSVEGSRSDEFNGEGVESGDKNCDVDFLIIPIPIHKKRRVERGYNQCELICQSLMENLKINDEGSKSPSNLGRRENLGQRNNLWRREKIKLSYNPNFLIRIKYTKKQSWSSRKDREQNLQQVFEVPRNFQTKIKGQKIILIDDVVTTGSTIKEARRTLLESGASIVITIVIAH